MVAKPLSPASGFALSPPPSVSQGRGADNLWVGMEGQPGPELPASCPCVPLLSLTLSHRRCWHLLPSPETSGGTHGGPLEGVALGPWEAEGAGRSDRGHSGQLVRAMGEPAVPTQSSQAAPDPLRHVSLSLSTEQLDLKKKSYIGGCWML